MEDNEPMTTTEYNKIELQKKNSSLKKYKLHYMYGDQGMEGRRDEYPVKILEAPSKEMANYIYHLMFHDHAKKMTFYDFVKDKNYSEWGMSIYEEDEIAILK